MQSERPDTPEADKALRAAIQWHVQLSEASDDAALSQSFGQWLERDESHAQAWSHACRVMGLLEHGKNVSVLPVRKAHPLRRAMAVAGMAAALVVAFVAVPQLSLIRSADHVTAVAEQETITLEDGSAVRLGPGSALRVSYTSHARQVELLKGEAYFEVARDANRPFGVKAQDTRVTVLGTGFNVRLGRTGADVAVNHGRVRVDYREGKAEGAAILIDGQWIRQGEKTIVGEGASANVGSWGAQRLVAIAQPVSEVVHDLRRYYGGIILVTGKAVDKRIVTGSYDVSDPHAALEVMLKPVGGKVIKLTPWVLVVSD